MSEDAKTVARKAAFAARKRAHEAGHGAVLSKALRREIGPITGRIIAGYMPIRTEADPVPVMTDLSQMNQICVPVIDGSGQPLRFRQWRPDAQMVEGPFGAAIPAKGDWLEPDIVIVPLVGFDAACNRLGYGGGFYDRTLAGLRARGQVRALGLAYAAQELPSLPLEPTDERLDCIVTETHTLVAPPDPA